MKKFNSPLLSILEVTTQQTRLKSIELGRKSVLHGDLTKRLMSILEFRQRFENGLADSIGRSASIQEIDAFRAELNRLNAVAEKYAGEAAEIEKEIELLRGEYQNHLAKQEAVEGLVETRRREHQELELRNEQLELEEIAIQSRWKSQIASQSRPSDQEGFTL